MGLGLGGGLAPRKAGFFLGFAAGVEGGAGGGNGDEAVAGGLVGIAILEAGDVADQAGEDGAMNGVIGGVAVVELDSADVGEGVVELGVNVLPFAHSEVGKETCFAEFAALALGAEAVPFLMHGMPDVEEGKEIGLGAGELLVRGGGGVALVEGAFTRVLNAQAGGDDEQLGGGVLALRLEQHAAEGGIDGQMSEVPAELRQRPLLVEGARVPGAGRSRWRWRPARAAGRREWFSMSPRRKAFMRRMTSARLARWISGWVKRGGAR